MSRIRLFFLILGSLFPSADGATAQEISPILFSATNYFVVLDANGKAMEHPFWGGFNTPLAQFVDFDRDGLLDLFVQNANGQLLAFKNNGTAQQPRLALSHDNFLRDITFGTWFQFAPVSPDGSLRLFVEKPYNKVQVIRFDEARFDWIKPQIRTESLLATDGQPVFAEIGSVPQFADADCDGDLDYFTTKQDGSLSFYRMTGFDTNGLPMYTLVSNTFGGISLVGTYCGTSALAKTERHGSASATFHDENGDGKPDILWGDTFISGILKLENTGTCTESTFKIPANETAYPNFLLPIGLDTSGLNQAQFADLDGDGDDDLLVSVLSGFCPDQHQDAVNNLHFYRNTGTKTQPVYTLVTERFLETIDLGRNSHPAWVDLDGDADLDLVVGNEDGTATAPYGRLFWYENKGQMQDGVTEVLQLKDDNFLNIQNAYGLAPAFGDLNNDGLPDLLLGGQNGKIRFYQNTGNQNFTEISRSYLGIQVGTYSTPTLGDMEGDGDLDLLIGSGNGALVYYRNDGTPQAPNFVTITDWFGGLSGEGPSAPTIFSSAPLKTRFLMLNRGGGNAIEMLDLAQPDSPRLVDVLNNQSTSVPATLTSVAIRPMHAAQEGSLPYFFLISGTVQGGLLEHAIVPQLPPANEDEMPQKPQPLTIFPNPTHGSIQVEFSLNHPAALTYRVVDVLGRTVHQSSTASVRSDAQTWHFDAHTLPTGTYWLVIEAGQTMFSGSFLVR